eukprot:287143_1
MQTQPEYDDDHYWLLIGGTDSSPSSVDIAHKKRDDSNFVDSIKSDLNMMDKYIHRLKYNVVQNQLMDIKGLKVETVIARIKECTKEGSDKKGSNVDIYYT